jgi:plasmid maintenance system killer protein
VPGGHNRWGYARELSYWKEAEGGSEGDAARTVLQKAVFEGFMTTSKEESLDEVQGGSENDDSDQTAFEATISRVLPDVATVELRRFRSSGEVSYREPDQVGRQYLDVDIYRAPDISRTLENSPRTYNEPAGFLTSLHRYIREAIRDSENKDALNRLKREVRTYVHNALLYSIRLRKTKKHKSVELNENWRIGNVLELEFDARRKEASSGHKFSIWVPVEGEFAGIPIRIVDKPRWWLKVELTLKKPNASEPGPVSAIQGVLPKARDHWPGPCPPKAG